MQSLALVGVPVEAPMEVAAEVPAVGRVARFRRWVRANAVTLMILL